MKKEFLNLDEFKALLAGHGYQWGDANTNSLILGALDSKALTPVFFYDGTIDLTYTERAWNLSDPNTQTDEQCYLRGYVSLPCADITLFYLDTIKNIADTYIMHMLKVDFHRTYGGQVPKPSESVRNSQNIQGYFSYIRNMGYEVNFNELVYLTEQAESLLSPLATDDTATLTHEINEAKAIIAQQKERIAELEQAQASQPNEELHPKTLKTVSHLLNVLFDKARFDIDAHMGTTNSQIVELSNKLNTPITKKPVSYWIKQVKQLRIDKNIG